MKMAIIGTSGATVEGVESTILREVGTTYLQRLSGYMPPQLPHNIPENVPVVDEFVAYADTIMTRLCDTPIQNCNPRIPYLYLIWLLIGEDNPYRIYRHAENRQLVIQVVQLLLRIVCGDELPFDVRRRVARAASIEKLNTLYPVHINWVREQIRNRTRAMKRHAVATALLRAAGVANTQQYAVEWVGWSASSVISEIDRIESGDIKSTLYEQAQEWCSISDAECTRITRKFVFDLLPDVT